METLIAGIENLRLAQILAERSINTPADRDRLDIGITFIRRALAQVNYLHDGATEGLEDGGFAEQQYARRTVLQLNIARNYPEFREYLSGLLESLHRLKHNAAEVSVDEFGRLESFFATVGQAMASEVIDVPPLDDYDMGTFDDDTNVDFLR